MPSCEKCWADSAYDRYFGDDQAYEKLLKKRNSHTCSPEEQAGPDATKCPRCHRMTLHQFCHVCMVPGCETVASSLETP